MHFLTGDIRSLRGKLKLKHNKMKYFYYLTKALLEDIFLIRSYASFGWDGQIRCI